LPLIGNRARFALPCRRMPLQRVSRRTWIRAALLTVLPLLPAGMAAQSAEDRIVEMLRQNPPYHRVPPELFELFGPDLPDGGAAVKTLADAAAGSAFDPRALEKLPAATLGYRAKWQGGRVHGYRTARGPSRT